ncbi:MAG: hypothetical protein M1823_002565 [Watsoniomyces obsoletus]|nr:MAG: hypothetical protein M1823_002565 [Watsoniomyces obsoletus]
MVNPVITISTSRRCLQASDFREPTITPLKELEERANHSEASVENKTGLSGGQFAPQALLRRRVTLVAESSKCNLARLDELLQGSRTNNAMA